MNIYSISPSGGPWTGNNFLTLYGQDLPTSGLIYFGQNIGGVFQYTSSSTWEVICPSGAPQTYVDVVVYSSGMDESGVLPSGYYYQSFPIASSGVTVNVVDPVVTLEILPSQVCVTESGYGHFVAVGRRESNFYKGEYTVEDLTNSCVWETDSFGSGICDNRGSGVFWGHTPSNKPAIIIARYSLSLIHI